MIRTLLVAACTLLCVVSNAEARPKHRVKAPAVECFIFCPGPDHARVKTGHSYKGRSNWTKPRAWCGWWMRKRKNVANPAGNRARWWAGYGTRASGPAVGTIVVWRHHVGEITGRAPDGRWIVLSGNDGNRVRERPRSLRGAIAYRWPAGGAGTFASRGQAL